MPTETPPTGTGRLADAWRTLAGSDALLLGLLLVACFFRLGELSLAEMDDITHAVMGKSILLTRDWFTMHEGLQVSFLKPPLYFWLEAALFKVFGVADYWARFPDAVCGFVTLLLTYRIGILAAGRKAAFWAVILLCTSTFFMKSSRRAMLDVPATMALCLGVWALLKAELQGRDRFYLLAGLSLAIGYYFKAIQGLYLLGVAGAYFVLSGGLRRLFNPWLLGGLALAAGLISAWVWPQYLHNGADFLYSQSGIGPIVNRGLSNKTNSFYIPLIKLFGVFLWTPLSIFGVWAAYKRKDQPVERRAILLLLCWIAMVMCALAVSKAFYLRYLLAVFVPLAIFGGIAAERLLAGRDHDGLRAWALAGFAAVLAVFIILPIRTDGPGTEFLEMYRTADAVIPGDARMTLYKDKSFKFNQGLAYYSDRVLWRQVSTPEEAAAAIAGETPFCLIVTRNNFGEVEEAVKQGKLKLKVAAATPGWRLLTP